MMVVTSKTDVTISVLKKPKEIDQYVFSGLTPKGEEWLQLHLPDDKVDITYREALKFKHFMENEGLSVEVL